SNDTLLSADMLNWITAALGAGATVRSAHQMAGSSSTTLYGIDAQQAGRELKLVLRLYDNAEWLAEEPDVAAHEAAALGLAGQTGLPVPECIAFDAQGAVCGVPALLMTRVPGAINITPADFADWLRQLAAPLARIHALPTRDFPWNFFPYYDLQQPTIPAWSGVPAAWEQAFAVLQGPPPEEHYCFIHRDYHPMNVLWQDDTLCGIVDWPNACYGPAGFDAAYCRLDLVAMYGLAVADQFLRIYEAQTGASLHPYWDLLALADWLPQPEVYSPWQVFGLPHVDTPLLRQRLDEHLVSTLARLR
ncbi:MAG TPA: phosphotransferase, partial [Spirillospora sp.]|nr:phosphotransferase [Spirillospora sp.]